MEDGWMGGFRAGRRGPVEGEHLIGVDRDRARRPGVPMYGSRESMGEGVPASLVEQAGWDGRVHRASLEGPTPVFGSAQPLRGLSGALRRAAYHIPEHHARHWALLMLADRTDVLEDRAASVVARPFALGAGLAIGAMGAWALLRRRS